MPTAHPPRSAATRAAATRAAVTAALLLALTGCSLFDGDSGSGTDAADRGASTPSASPSGSASAGASADTVEETCARVLEAARTAPEQLQQDPVALLAEVEDIAATAPTELSGEIISVREAIDGFRQGERSMISVIGEARALQERCSG
ncbi:hypothetical protein [Kocuria aegyptia]|uniref:Lipoprotein n=1 Tax=Kocuria aegyptia TaxID=330943 RepID=A0ABN2KCG2_9MICC